MVGVGGGWKPCWASGSVAAVAVATIGCGNGIHDEVVGVLDAGLGASLGQGELESGGVELVLQLASGAEADVHLLDERGVELLLVGGAGAVVLREERTHAVEADGVAAQQLALHDVQHGAEHCLDIGAGHGALLRGHIGELVEAQVGVHCVGVGQDTTGAVVLLHYDSILH